MKPEDITIVVADDHPFLLEGLVNYLTKQNYTIVGKASDGEAAFSLIESKVPKLAILDVEMPRMSGIDVARKCNEKALSTRFILLSYLKEPAVVIQAMEANILGYILKEDASHELNRCIRTVMRGETYQSLNIRSIDTKRVSNELMHLESLTRSEMKILRLIAEGHSTKSISEHLFISSRTVEKHRSNIVSKLGIEKQSHALSQWAIANKKLIIQ